MIKCEWKQVNIEIAQSCQYILDIKKRKKKSSWKLIGEFWKKKSFYSGSNVILFVPEGKITNNTV